MFKSLVLNFCLLVTLMYLLSLTYRNTADIAGLRFHVPRTLLISLLGIALMLYPAEVAPGVIIDMRVVPVAYLALRKGLVIGLLGTLPVLAYRFYLGGSGVTPAVFSVFGVALLAGLFRPSLSLFAETVAWRSVWWKILLVFAPNGFLLPWFQGDASEFLTIYLPLNVMAVTGFLITLGILRNRFKLLSLVSHYEQQAHQDTLSQLPNRRQFDQDAAALEPTDLLCLVDIDHFKAVNDTYGHAAGDEVLAQLGGLLKTRLRSHDQAYRYGGEEFAVLFRSPGTADPIMLAERLRQAVEAASFSALRGKSLTVSVGVAYRGSEGTLQDCFDRADAALYAAKAAGRNRAVLWSPELQPATHK